jgi:hypothetical protein
LIAGGSAALVGLVADDATGVGVADDEFVPGAIGLIAEGISML